MDKSTTAALAVLLLVIGGGAAYLLLFPSGSPPFSFTQTGFEVLSMQSGTRYVSSDPFWNSDAYDFLIAWNGHSQEIEGTFTPDDVAAFTGATKPAGPFKIRGTISNYSCAYNLLSAPIPVYTYQDFRYCCTTSCNSECTFWTSTKVGDIYQIDSSYNPEAQISLNLDSQGGNFTATLSPEQQQADVANAMRASITGGLYSLYGSCPIPGQTTVLFRPTGSAALIPKSSAFLSQLGILQNRIREGQIGSTYTYSPPAPYSYTDANSYVNAFVASTASTSGICDSVSISATDSKYRCVTTYPTFNLLMKLTVKGSVMGVSIPSGSPQIISVSSPAIEAANLTRVPVLVKNNGESDTIAVSIYGKDDITLRSEQVAIASGAQQTVDLRIQAVGIIGNYTVKAASVNSPQKFDTKSVRLLIEPFCDRPAEPGKIKVSTEFGCYYVCSETSFDVREKTCEKFGTFEPRGQSYNRSTLSINEVLTCGSFNNELDCNSYSSYGCDWSSSVSACNPVSRQFTVYGSTKINYINEYHCTGVGSYMSLNDYMDNILAKQQQPFIASPKENAFWISAPYCNHWAAYGYKMQGGSVVFVEDANYYLPNGQPVSIPQNGTQAAPGSGGSGTENPPTILPGIPPIVLPDEDNSLVWGIGIFILIVLVIWAVVIYSRKK